MFAKSIKLSRELFDKLERVAVHTGHSDAASYASEVLTTEVDKRLEEMQTEKELKGLGYIE